MELLRFRGHGSTRLLGANAEVTAKEMEGCPNLEVMTSGSRRTDEWNCQPRLSLTECGELTSWLYDRR